MKLKWESRQYVNMSKPVHVCDNVRWVIVDITHDIPAILSIRVWNSEHMAHCDVYSSEHSTPQAAKRAAHKWLKANEYI